MGTHSHDNQRYLTNEEINTVLNQQKSLKNIFDQLKNADGVFSLEELRAITLGLIDEYILDHRVKRHRHDDIQSHVPAEFLVISPVQKSEDRDHDQLFSEHGKPGDRFDHRPGKNCLEPFLQSDFPLKEKTVIGYC